MNSIVRRMGLIIGKTGEDFFAGNDRACCAVRGAGSADRLAETDQRRFVDSPLLTDGSGIVPSVGDGRGARTDRDGNMLGVYFRECPGMNPCGVNP